jgi:hypothetical protein
MILPPCHSCFFDFNSLQLGVANHLSAVPEPGSIALPLLGAVAIGGLARKTSSDSRDFDDR